MLSVSVAPRAWMPHGVEVVSHFPGLVRAITAEPLPTSCFFEFIYDIERQKEGLQADEPRFSTTTDLRRVATSFSNSSAIG